MGASGAGGLEGANALFLGGSRALRPREQDPLPLGAEELEDDATSERAPRPSLSGP